MEKRDLAEKIIEYIDGKLTPEEEKSLAQEIDGNPQAEQILADMILLHGIMPGASAELEHMNESTMTAIQSIIDKNNLKYTSPLAESEKTKKGLFRQRLFWTVFGAAAASILLFFGLPIISDFKEMKSLKERSTCKNRDDKGIVYYSRGDYRRSQKTPDTSSSESPVITKEEMPIRDISETNSERDTWMANTDKFKKENESNIARGRHELVSKRIKELESKQYYYYDSPGSLNYLSGNLDGRLEPYKTLNEYPDPGTEQYEQYTENNFHNALKRPLSTFAIDVDTASYSNIRRFILRESRLPHPCAVRIEEMINYFVYDYPKPEGNHPFSLYTEVGTCPWNTSRKLIHIGLQGAIPPETHIPNSNLVFLLDVSGSMQDADKLPLVKKTMGLLVSQLRKHDRISIVTYATGAQTVLDAASGSDKNDIIRTIGSLRAEGSTAGEYGLRMAYDTASKSYMEEGNNRIIVATDGDFNVGMSDDNGLVRLIEKERERGIFLTILGFGTGNIKDAKLEKIANRGNGHYAYIDSILEGKKVMLSQVKGTLHTIAKDVKIQIEFNPANVKAYRLIGYENRKLAAKDFHDDTKDAGELGAGHTVTALYEIIPAGSDENIITGEGLRYRIHETAASDPLHKNELMTIKLRYKFPKENKSSLIQVIVPNKTSRAQNTSNTFRFSAAVAEMGLILRNSRFRGNSNLAQVISLAKSAKGRDDQGLRAEFIKMAEKAELIIK